MRALLSALQMLLRGANAGKQVTHLLQHCCADVVFKHASCVPGSDLLLMPSAVVSTALCSPLWLGVMPDPVLGTPESSPGMVSCAVCFDIPCSVRSATS